MIKIPKGEVSPVLKSTLYVIERAKSVKINCEKIKELAEKWVKGKMEIPSRPAEDILDTDDERIILDYLIILDTINFCFWSPFAKASEDRPSFSEASEGRAIQKEKWNIEYKGKRYDGYFAMSLALKRFFEKNPEKANIEYFSKISFKDFCYILKGKGDLQFLKERWRGVKLVSKVLSRKYNGDSRKFVKSAKDKFSILVPKIYKELPTFDDIAEYGGKKIYLLKRAQILACDICFAFGNKEIGHFVDLDYLTVMPDYKLPQILFHWGVLSYSYELAGKVNNKVLIPVGSEEEVEIRAATVWAVEYLKEELAVLGRNFHSYELDWILWAESQKEKMQNNYHLTKSIYY
jgi:YHS domain-containing protein